jgi:hypothetical protein
MRTSLFLGVLFLSLSFFAQSNLTVFNNGGQKFYLIMNGIKQNSVAQTNVVVSSIKNGGYSVKLIFEDGKTKDIDKNFFLDTPQDVTTRVIFKKGVGKLQLVSMVPAAGMVTEGSVSYRPDNSAVFSDAVTTTTTTTTQTVSTETSAVGGNTTNGNGNGSVGIQFNAATPTPTPTTTPNTNTTVTPTNGGNGNVNISVTDPVNGENINMNVNMNMNGTVVDPNAQNVNMNVNVSGNGTQQNTSNTRPGANTNVNVGTTSNSSTQQTTTNGANVNVNVSGTGVNPSVNATVPGATTNVTVNGGTVTQNSSNSTITTTTTTTNAATTVNGTTNASNGTNTVGGTSNGRMVCSKTLSNVETLKTELNGYSFEDDRVGALKISLKNKCLYAADAVQLMDLFTFDANQLEVAKFLSDHLADYDNASSLAAKFAFDSSKMEYMEYVGRD